MAKNTIILLSAMLFLITIACGESRCESINVEKVVDRFYKETDLQKTNFVESYKSDKLIVSAEVKDVKEEDTFDTANDIKRRYYKIVTQTRKTAGDNNYAVVLVYKDPARVRDIAKGQWINKTGKLLKVVDEGLLLSVWLYEEELAAEEMRLFK